MSISDRDVESDTSIGIKTLLSDSGITYEDTLPSAYLCFPCHLSESSGYITWVVVQQDRPDHGSQAVETDATRLDSEVID